MKVPKNKQYILFGGNFVLANKMQWVADRCVGGLTSKQWFLLRTLSDMPQAPPTTITSLAQETDTTRQNVTKLLEVLARQGCVKLEENPQDHRSRRVLMTEKGHKLLRSMAEQSGDFFQGLFAGIGEEEVAAAAAVTLKMIENLNKMQQHMQPCQSMEKKEQAE